MHFHCVVIDGADRAGRERRLRHCARPPFALDRLRELDPERVLYESTKPGPGGNGSRLLTPLELLDRIDEVFPLVCPNCAGAMRIIAFVTDGPTVRDILAHLGEPTAPPRIAPARKCHDKRAEQPVATANRRLTRPTGFSTLRSVPPVFPLGPRGAG